MKRVKILFIVLLMAQMCQGQDMVTDSSSTFRETIIDQAIVMRDAMISGDINTFVNFYHPAVIKVFGSKEDAIQGTKTALDDFHSKGISFQEVVFGMVSNPIPSPIGLQCTVSQTTTLKTKDGKYIVKSTLIAISDDNGLRWLFIDTGGKTLEQVRQTMDFVSEKLELLNEKPVFIPD